MSNIKTIKLGTTTYNIYDNTAVHYTANASISVAGTTKTTNTLSPSTLFVSNGLIMGGTALQAGLVTRGICGVTTPNSTTGACNKDHLYINYDGDNNYSRKVVLGAESTGSVISNSNNAYTYCAVRGDQMVTYVTNAISGKANTSDLADVATSGSYNDLSDTPTIDSALSSTSTNAVQNKVIYTALSGKQDKLTAGSNITISGTTISSSYTDTKNTAGSTNSTSKLFLIGATSQATNPQTYSNSYVYVSSDSSLYSKYLHPTDGIWFYSSSYRITNMFATRVYYSFSSPSAGTDHYKDVSIIGSSIGSGKWFAVASSFGTTSDTTIPTTGSGSYATYYTTSATILSTSTIRIWFHMTQTYSGTFIAWADVIAVKYY